MNKCVISALTLLVAVQLWAEMREVTYTGTAFAITADGYLLTCNHLVENSDSVMITLNGKVYEASVLNTDNNLDIALLQIQATGLQYLSLTNSNKVQLGEEVRAMGFPLSNAIGTNIKVTRGSISGMNIIRTKKTFQIDAPINPGNSGGPLVNENGEVIGIVNSKLVDPDIENAGFAVPINYSTKLLRDEYIELQPANYSEKKDGPSLVKMLSPSIALVTVKTTEWVEEEKEDEEWFDELAFLTTYELLYMYIDLEFRESRRQVTFLANTSPESSLIHIRQIYYDNELPADKNQLNKLIVANGNTIYFVDLTCKNNSIINSRWKLADYKNNIVVQHAMSSVVNNQLETKTIAVTINGITSQGGDEIVKGEKMIKAAGGIW